MKKIQLTQIAHIPDETWDPEDPENKGKPAPVATNYPGATLSVSDAIADQLVSEGKAKLVVDEPPPVPESEPETSEEGGQ